MWAIGTAAACGGFFCSGGGTADYGAVPVEQNSERILFVVNGDETVTTFVEVGYQQNEDVDFAWVIPIPEAISADDVGTASADLFNDLEMATAPTFTFFRPASPDFDDDGGGGCIGPMCAGSGGSSSAMPAMGGTTSEVVVVDEAVIGPFAIEVITATDAELFAAWLEANGYDLPDNAVDPLAHYISLGMAFLGVQLAPEVPDGPIDTLEFTYTSSAPMIPLILTSIASAADLPIVCYVLADEPYAPANWATIDDPAPDTRPDGAGGTNYLALVAERIDAEEGLAFALELSLPTNEIALADPDFAALLLQRGWLTRWRGDISPSQMVLDPEFAPSPGLAAYDNDHLITLPPATASSSSSSGSRRSQVRGAWLALPLVVGIWRSRKKVAARAT
jgi:hypothetical protein